MFKDKKVLVTGAASGIGLCIAQMFQAQGATVIATDINEDRLAAMEKVAPGRLLTKVSDAGKVSEIRELAAWIESELGGLDVLVNNAGFAIQRNPENVEEADYDLQMDVMLKGPVFLIQHLAELLRASDNGSVINMSSASAQLSSPGYCPYALAKAAIDKLSQDCVVQVPGVRHNTIMPGFIETAILMEAYGEEAAAKIREVAAALIPAGRMGAPEDIAATALFLASDAARYINGANIVVDGGLSHLNAAIAAVVGTVSLP